MLNFDDPVSDACTKASGKLNALAKIAPFIGLYKNKQTNKQTNKQKKQNKTKAHTHEHLF